MKKYVARLPGSMMRWILGALLWAAAMSAHATPTCSFSGLTFNPSTPSRIAVRSSVPADTIIFSTIVSAQFNCTGGVNGDTFLLSSQVVGGAGGGTSQVVGVTNVSVTGHQNSTPSGPMYGYTSGVTGPCSQTGVRPPTRPIMQFSGSGTCRGQVGFGLAFFATNTGAVSGTIPSALQAGYIAFPGWLLALECAGSVCGTIQGTIGSINGPAIPITTVSRTCTLTSPNNQTVVLPTVSRSAFTGVGSTAGAVRALTIQYNCSGSGAMSLSMAWIFSADNQSSTGVSVLNNTGSATGVGVQIVDSSWNPVITGEQSQRIAAVVNGVNTINYVVRYYQTSASVTAGTVNATAQFTATYN